GGRARAGCPRRARGGGRDRLGGTDGRAVRRRAGPRARAGRRPRPGRGAHRGRGVAPSTGGRGRPRGSGGVTDRAEDGVRVIGGAGGTRVCLEALVATAARVERAGWHLEAAAVRAEALARHADQSATWSPGTAALVREEAAALLSPR